MTHNAEYDAIAKEYQESKLLPFRKYAEEPTILKLLGDVRGKKVLDLACGEGIYSRKLKKLGAAAVVAIDLSSEMVALGQALEGVEPLGIEYAVGDASKLGKIGEFDIILASYLFNYAKSEDELAAFCRTVAVNLKQDGRMVGMNDNPANDIANYPQYRPYGFVKSSPDNRREGDPITYTFYMPDEKIFSFDNYYLAPATYDRVFAKTGFKSLAWHKPAVTPDGIQKLGSDYWVLFENDPPVIGIEAIK